MNKWKYLTTIINWYGLIMANVLCVAAVVVMFLAALGVVAGAEGDWTAHASEPGQPPYNADAIAIFEISGGVYAVITNNVHMPPDTPGRAWTFNYDNGIRIRHYA